MTGSSRKGFMRQHTLIFILMLLFIGCLYAVEVSGDQNTVILKESLWETIVSGGWMMVPLALCTLFGLGLASERLSGLKRSSVLPAELEQNYDRVLKKVIDGEKNRSVLAPLLTDRREEGAVLYRRFLERSFENTPEMELVLQEYVEVSLYHLMKNVKPLGLITQLAPLLGLLGTVVGMIDAFDVVALKGLGKPELLASGMAKALLTTGFGLGIAIPCTIVYHHLNEKAVRLSLDLYNKLHTLSLALMHGSSKTVS